MEDFDLGSSFPNLVQASTVSSDEPVFGDYLQTCLDSCEDKKDALQKQLFPSETQSTLSSRDFMRQTLSTGEIEHSILSGTDFMGADMSSCFASPHDSTAIHSLRRLGCSDLLPNPSPGMTIPTNVSNLAFSASKEHRNDQEPSLEFLHGLVSTSQANSSQVMDAGTELEGLLSPVTKVTKKQTAPYSETRSHMSSPHSNDLQMEAFFLNPDPKTACVSEEEVPQNPHSLERFPPLATLPTSAQQLNGNTDDVGSFLANDTFPSSHPTQSKPLNSTSPYGIAAPQSARNMRNESNITSRFDYSTQEIFLRSCTGGYASGSQSLPPITGLSSSQKKTPGRNTTDSNFSISDPCTTEPGIPKVKEHACGICGISFAAKCNLFKHQRAVHLGLRPYACTLCSSAFSERNKLQKHILTVHRLERNHRCSLCETRFGQKSDLRRHVQVVHEQQKKFACLLCGRAFGRRSSLSQHMQRVHNRKLPPLREDPRKSVSMQAVAAASAMMPTSSPAHTPRPTGSVSFMGQQAPVGSHSHQFAGNTSVASTKYNQCCQTTQIGTGRRHALSLGQIPGRMRPGSDPARIQRSKTEDDGPIFF